MKKIEFVVLNQHEEPSRVMMALARLTQKGHKIKTSDDLQKLFNSSYKSSTAHEVSRLPHGTIQRFTPITIGIVGASRRFLAQARTHQVGINYVSASLQYSDYSNEADFVVPHEIMDSPIEQNYLEKCKHDMAYYKAMIENGVDNDTAGYAMNQALRNVLVINANHEAWKHFIRTRGCNRNTSETQYVAIKIWEILLHTNNGEEMFNNAGPDCVYGSCREGKMSCGKPLPSSPAKIIRKRWPKLVNNN